MLVIFINNNRIMAATMQQKKTGASSGGLKSQLLNQYGGKDESALPQTLMLDHVSPATRLLEKRRQMFEVQEALNAQKDEFNRRENAFRRREGNTSTLPKLLPHYYYYQYSNHNK